MYLEVIECQSYIIPNVAIKDKIKAEIYIIDRVEKRDWCGTGIPEGWEKQNYTAQKNFKICTAGESRKRESRGNKIHRG